MKTKLPGSWFFDLDGTLVDSLPGIESALRHAFQSAGRTIPADRLREAIGPSIGVIAKHLAPELSPAQTALVEAVYRQRYDETAWQGTSLFPQVPEVLQRLASEGRRLFVLTNKPRIPTAKILAHLALAPFFEDVLTRDSQAPPFVDKAAMLRYLLQKHDIEPHDAVFVGDTDEDGAAAAANAVRFVFVTYGYGRGSRTEPPTDRIDHFATLLSFTHTPAVPQLRKSHTP